jgi:hypothetical protein
MTDSTSDPANAEKGFKHENEVYAAFEALVKQAEASGFTVDMFEDKGETCIRVIKCGETRIEASLPGVTKSLLFPQQVEKYLNKHIDIATRQGFHVTFRVLADGTPEAQVLRTR